MLVCTMPSRFARAGFGTATSDSGAAGDSPTSDSDPITDGRFVMLASLHASVRPLPQRADFVRRFSVRSIFRDPEPGSDGVLKFCPQREQRLGKHAEHLQTATSLPCPGASCVRRTLVQNEREVSIH